MPVSGAIIETLGLQEPSVNEFLAHPDLYVTFSSQIPYC
jgi:hypothetical protein